MDALTLNPEAGWQLGLLTLEVLIISGLLLGLFQLRALFGMSMLYLALGVFQQMQVVLAVSIYVELAPGLLISPGSAVLFTASLFAVLLVYIKEGAFEARRLVYGLIVANLVLSLLTVLFGLHLRDASTRNLLDLPPEMFTVNPRVLIVGTVVLFVDVLAMIVVFDALARVLRRALFLRILITMAAVVVLDSVLFSLGSFFGQERMLSLMLASMTGKLFATLLFTAVFTFYVSRLDREGIALAPSVTALDIFQLFTYRQRFEQLRERAERDALTGAYNRGHFDRRFAELLAAAATGKEALVLALIDLDRFKQVNDECGHSAGDEVLRRLVTGLRDELRADDVLCRYGGEEFAIVLPAVSLLDARAVVERMRSAIGAASETQHWLQDGRRVTFTAGLAVYPDDATEVDELIRIADTRLYEGKRLGRNQVVIGRYAAA